MLQMHTPLLQFFAYCKNKLLLRFCIGVLLRILRHIRHCKVGVYALDFQVPQQGHILDGVSTVTGCFAGKPDAPHARVQLHMTADGGAGSGVEGAGVLGGNNALNDIVLGQRICIFRWGIPKNQHVAVRALLPYMQCLIQVGNGKVAHPELVQLLQDLCFAMSVCIRLDHRHDLGIALERGRNGTDV